MLSMLMEMQSHPRGVTASGMSERLEIGLSTIYRYLDLLKNSPLPLAFETVNGEKRYWLVADVFSLPRPSEGKVVALSLARQFLAPLEGLEAVKEIDSFLKLSPKVGELPASTAEHGPAHNPQHLRVLERAKNQRNAVRLRYRGPQGRTQERVVEPVDLRHHDGHVYARTWDVAKRAWRTFKLARIQEAEVVVGQDCVHPPYDVGAGFADSVGVWSGHPVQVRIRVAPENATLVREHPLSTRAHVTEGADGSLLIEDRVAGLVEVMVWVMRWGRHAEVLEPAELRQRVREEHAAAAALYAEAPVARRRRAARRPRR
jgi:proteasome accessory factor B